MISRCISNHSRSISAIVGRRVLLFILSIKSSETPRGWEAERLPTRYRGFLASRQRWRSNDQTAHAGSLNARCVAAFWRELHALALRRSPPDARSGAPLSHGLRGLRSAAPRGFLSLDGNELRAGDALGFPQFETHEPSPKARPS